MQRTEGFMLKRALVGESFALLLGCTVVERGVSVIVSIGSADLITGYAPDVV